MGLQPVRESLSVQTGAMDCSKKCFFLEEGVMKFGGLMITDTHETTNVLPVALGICELVIVAVGGGGGGNDNSYSGGGGSGYIDWKKENLTGIIELQVSVGGESGRS